LALTRSGAALISPSCSGWAHALMPGSQCPVPVSLVRLLPRWTLDDIEAHAVFTNGHNAKPAARAFVDHLVEELRSI
jgi:DNA-binding transcriptional LysR family regulator